ncbi:MAG TPA: acyltransferase family protein [Chitinophagaceae bacterium]|nr:acyltransferase family protein [Chitinophagaceae bacterium]
MELVPERKYYIDWIRVLAFFLLIFFHCAMPFVIYGWEVKNQEKSLGLSRLIWWMHQWRLPLLFFISGVGIYYSLKRRSVIAFAGERVVRLFIPLAFAMLFVIPLQVYFEKLQEGLIRGSYAKFYPTVWSFVPYPEGTLNWSHMWFVVYLFVFCILLLPVFAMFKIKWLSNQKEKISTFLSAPVTIFALVIPLTVYYFALYLKYPEQQSLFDDWFLFIFPITLLFYGYLLGGNTRLWESCEKYRFYFLTIAAVCALILFYNYWWQMKLPKQQGTSLYVFGILSAVHIWTIILAVCGFGKKHLNFSNRFLKYANQAVYPFYILHQTIIVAAGYYVVQWPLPIFIKLAILVVICFSSVLVIYQFIIKPFILTRILYGLKPREKK